MSDPKICAAFQLDGEGRPIAMVRNNRRHYKIRLFMEDVPQDAYAVTYKLHESYYNPTREVRRGATKFEEQITSYGDYVVKAEVRGKKASGFAAVELSRALKETYGSDPDIAIRQAIQEIQEE